MHHHAKLDDHYLYLLLLHSFFPSKIIILVRLLQKIMSESLLLWGHILTPDLNYDMG
jgi:hypothetical protein